MGLVASALEPVANNKDSRFDRKVVQLNGIKSWSLTRPRQEDLLFVCAVLGDCLYRNAPNKALLSDSR